MTVRKRYSDAERQRIIDRYLEETGSRQWRHGDFYDHVRERGPSHPAWDFFVWDDGEAGERYRLQQAREFGRGLRVTFRVRVIEQGRFKVKTTHAPLLVSDVARRKLGGGYLRFRPRDPTYQQALVTEALAMLEQWADRFDSVLISAGAGAELERLKRKLQQEEGSVRVTRAEPKAPPPRGREPRKRS